jgi:hypothetical protein
VEAINVKKIIHTVPDQTHYCHLPFLVALVFVLPAIRTTAVAISVTLHPTRVDLTEKQTRYLYVDAFNPS